MKMQLESLQGEKKTENNICESVFGTRSRGIRKKPLQNFKGLHTSHCRFVFEESRGKDRNRACEIYFK